MAVITAIMRSRVERIRFFIIFVVFYIIFI
jgi:hypothetical protein